MDKEEKKVETVEVPLSTITKLQESLAQMELDRENDRARMAGLEEMVSKGASTEAEPKLREKKNFEPKFRTVRIRKYPIAGDYNNQGYVIGWTSRGAYQEVDRSGVSPAIVDFIDVIFLGHERTEDGKIKAERVKLLDLFNNGVQVYCKIIDTKVESHKVETGEEIAVSTYDQNHGMISTGDTIDGYYAYSDITYTIQIPGVDKPVVIDSLFCN
jgi:hypothetical protein